MKVLKTILAGLLLLIAALDHASAQSSGDAPAARYYQTAVWTTNKMLVWGGINSNLLNNGGGYNVSANYWTTGSITNAPGARYVHSAVWTGNKMIIWGGTSSLSNLSLLNDGGRYDPAVDSWTTVNTSAAPLPRDGHTAVWTGTKMVIWGGQTNGGYAADGGLYDPANDSWTSVQTTGAPPARGFHTAVWTGTNMLVWGGYNLTGYLYSGAQYDPVANAWVSISSSINTPSPREDHTAVWTGSAMIIWGGFGGGGRTNSGGRYNPVTDIWTKTSTNGAPAARAGHTAVWTGSEMIVWGGRGVNTTNYLNDGACYNPVSDSWTNISTVGAPSIRAFHTAIWTGSEMIVWGGHASATNYLNDGGRYNPTTDTWTALPTNAAPLLSLQLLNSSNVKVAWPLPATGHALQQNTNIGTTNWTALGQTPSDDGTNKSLTLPVASGGHFYWLK